MPIVIQNEGWGLVGDLTLPAGSGAVPAVLLLNQADGDRTPYEGLAAALAVRGIASLRLDLRGHGESTNLGEFTPGEHRRDPLIWDAESDVSAAHEFLRRHERVVPDLIGIVGASYSGEEAAEAGRTGRFARAYVLLSPGSLSEESIDAMDGSGASWLLVAARTDRTVVDVTAAILDKSETADVELLSGRGHATNLLTARRDLADRIASWFWARFLLDAH